MSRSILNLSICLLNQYHTHLGGLGCLGENDPPGLAQGAGEIRGVYRGGHGTLHTQHNDRMSVAHCNHKRQADEDIMSNDGIGVSVGRYLRHIFSGKGQFQRN